MPSRRIGGAEGKLNTYCSSTSAGSQGSVSGERVAGGHRTGGWVGSRVGLNTVTNRNPVIQPATNWAIPARINN